MSPRFSFVESERGFAKCLTFRAKNDAVLSWHAWRDHPPFDRVLYIAANDFFGVISTEITSKSELREQNTPQNQFHWILNAEEFAEIEFVTNIQLQ